MRQRLFGMIAALVCAFGVVTGTAGTAIAGPADHNQDPVARGCASDAYTIAWRNVGGATLQLRYSPRCATNWLRVENYSGYYYFFVKSDARPNEVVDGSGYAGVPGTHWGRMAYAPGATCIYIMASLNGVTSPFYRIC